MARVGEEKVGTAQAAAWIPASAGMTEEVHQDAAVSPRVSIGPLLSSIPKSGGQGVKAW